MLWSPDDGTDATLLVGDDVLGRATRVEVAADSEEALWGARRTERLQLRASRDVPPAAVARVLNLWDELVAGRVRPGDREDAAVVIVPSRDLHLTEAVAAHGLAPLLTVAVRPAGRSGPPAPDLEVRRATRDDLEVLAPMAVALQGHDAHFGQVTRREAGPRILREGLAESLAGGLTPHWVAEGPEGIDGYLGVQLPPVSGWMAGAVAAERVAYLEAAWVRPEARGRGIAGALAAVAHAHLDEAGIEVTVLHHALPNPTSTPFWARQGYRPLLITWVRRPAAAGGAAGRPEPGGAG